MKTILVPIDFSAGSTRVLDCAIALARLLKGRLRILYVVSPLPLIDPDSGVRMSTEYALAASSLAAANLSALQRKLAKRSITAETDYLIETPGRAIVEQAERHHADFIVMGSHGHGAFYDVVVGSTTSRVLKQAPCPVVVVPIPGAKPKRRGKSAA